MCFLIPHLHLRYPVLCKSITYFAGYIFTVEDRYYRSPGLNAYFTDHQVAMPYSRVNMESQSCRKLVPGEIFTKFGEHINYLLINLILLVRLIIDYITEMMLGLESIVFIVK